MNDDNHTKAPPHFLGYKKTGEARSQKDEIKQLEAANQLISVVLGELHNIQELMGLNVIAEVEELEDKIKKGYEKIQQYLSRYEQGEELEQGQQQQQKQGKDSVPIEQHPFLQDMGGMPLELDKLDKDFLKELDISDTADKAEIQNQIKNKLQNRLKNALKFAAKLQNDLKAQPAYKPAVKQANELVMKYRLQLEDLKNKPMLKPEEKPEYVPRYTPPTPTPPRPF